MKPSKKEERLVNYLIWLGNKILLGESFEALRTDPQYYHHEFTPLLRGEGYKSWEDRKSPAPMEVK